jgi:hypothetical protein
LSGPARSPTATIFAFQVGKLVDTRIGARQNAHAAAMGAGGDLDIKTLLKRLQPAQRHAETCIGLAGRDRLQQLVGRAAVIDQLDVEILLLKESMVDGDGERREADRAGIPGQFQFSWRTRERRGIGRGLADRKFREIDIRSCRAERKCLRAEYA